MPNTTYAGASDVMNLGVSAAASAAAGAAFGQRKQGVVMHSSRVHLATTLLDVLERMNCGGVVLNASEALEVSPTAERILRESTSLIKEEPKAKWARNAITQLLSRGQKRFSMGSGRYWVIIPRAEQRPLIMHSVPVETSGLATEQVLVLVDLSIVPQPRSDTLELIFGLTNAEACLAVQVSSGEALSVIAEMRGVGMATVRTQLASVFQKT